MLDEKGGTPTPSRLLILIEHLKCDIWRTRNPKKCKYTFQQKHLSGIIQRRLHYIFVLQNLQEYVKKSDDFNVFLTHQSAVFSSLSNEVNSIMRKALGWWKFNIFLASDIDFDGQMKLLIEHIKKQLSESEQIAQKN